MSQMQTPQAPSRNDQAAFKPGLPHYIYENGGMAVFDIHLPKIGDMPSDAVLQAYVDPSHQYEADGSSWIALTAGCGFKAGDSIPKSRVDGWREKKV